MIEQFCSNPRLTLARVRRQQQQLCLIKHIPPQGEPGQLIALVRNREHTPRQRQHAPALIRAPCLAKLWRKGGRHDGHDRIDIPRVGSLDTNRHGMGFASGARP